MVKETSNQVKITDENTPRYFAMIPYMIDDMDLSPFAVRLYLRMVRRAGSKGGLML